jgi:hypothetical protein
VRVSALCGVLRALEAEALAGFWSVCYEEYKWKLNPSMTSLLRKIGDG